MPTRGSLRRLARSRFLRDVATLSGGNALAMALPVLAAPVLGRLYRPADYGALALYMAVVNVLAVVSALQFQQGIIAERSDRAALGLTWLCLILGGGAAVLVGLAAGVLWRPVLANTVAGGWLLFLPFSTAVTGFVAGTTFLANRHRRYRCLARIQVLHISVTVGLSFLLGVFGWGASGPIAAYLVGQAVQAAAHARLFVLLAGQPRWPGLKRLRALARRHRNCAIHTMPDQLMAAMSLQLPVFALGAMGAAHILGAFNRAQQLVSAPITLLGTAVAKVFQQEAAELYRRTNNCRPLLLRTAGGLFASGLPLCLLLLWAAPWVFETVLGPAWREAGELARILAPMLLLRLVVSPVGGVFVLTKRQKLSLLLSALTAAAVAASAVAALKIFGTPVALIWGVSASLGIIYIVCFSVVVGISAGKARAA